MFMRTPHDLSRPIRVFQQRDSVAMLELVGALSEQGYALGEPILNFPPLDEARDFVAVDRSGLSPGDYQIEVAADSLVAGRWRKVVRVPEADPCPRSPSGGSC